MTPGAEGCTPLLPGYPPCDIEYAAAGRKKCRQHGEYTIMTPGLTRRVACVRHLHPVMQQMRQNPRYIPGMPFTVTFLEL